MNAKIEFLLCAEELIPQKKPILLVDSLLESNGNISVSDFLIREDCVFVDAGRLVPAGLMENIAQTCALRIGYLSFGQRVRIGMVGAVKNFNVFCLPSVGDHLTTTIKVILHIDPALVVDAETRVGDKLVASCEMKVFLVEDEK